MAKWRQDNPDYYIKWQTEHSRLYYLANREHILDRCHQYYIQNRDKIKARTKEYYEQNSDSINAKRRERYQEHREELIAKTGEWRRKNPEKRKAEHAKRRARKYKLPNTLSNSQARKLLSVMPCFYCGAINNLTLDHFVPVASPTNAACGTTEANTVIACRKCNTSKGAKMPEILLKQLTFGLEA